MVVVVVVVVVVACWLAGWLARWLAGVLAGWLARLLAGWLNMWTSTNNFWKPSMAATILTVSLTCSKRYCLISNLYLLEEPPVGKASN